MASRADILVYAAAHGAKAAGDHFGIPAGTIRSWRSRARKRSARDGTPPPPPTPAERYEAEARRIADRFVKRLCLQCGGEGTVTVPATTRGSLLIRRPRRLPCPTCGGTPLRIEVVTHPRGKWLEGLAAAGDAGFGWSGAEWSRIQAGDVNPDGLKFTGRDTPGGGQ